jgi:hypothetical protein
MIYKLKFNCVDSGVDREISCDSIPAIPRVGELIKESYFIYDGRSRVVNEIIYNYGYDMVEIEVVLKRCE